MQRICFFGLGEAGSRMAADLSASGVPVIGFDPAPVPTPPGVVRAHDPVTAVEGATVVIAITAATDAQGALEQALAAIPPFLQYADFSTAAPHLKRALSTSAVGAGLRFTDVALMGTVAGRGITTPALASGPDAEALADTMRPLGMELRVVGAAPGMAATHKLLRSVAVKGLTAVVIECMNAAHQAGLADETWANIAAQITSADEEFLRRLVEGAGRHAQRRGVEMEAACELLADLGVAPLLTRATVTSLHAVAEQGVPELPERKEGMADANE